MNTILVTGATGFIGSHLVEALLEARYTLRLLVRRSNALIESYKKRGADVVIGSFDDTERLQQALAGVETVIHVAGATKCKTEAEYMYGNLQGTRNLLAAMRRGQRIILISSQAAGGPSLPDQPIDETAPGNPLTFYGKSKLAGEKEVFRWGETNDNNFVILRPSAVFGPREKDFFTYFKLAKQGIAPILGSGRKQFSIIYVKDFVRAIIKTLESDTKRRIFYVCNNDGCTWNEFGGLVKQAIGGTVISVKIPEITAYPVAFVSELFARFSDRAALINRQKIIEMRQDAWLCSNRRISEELGWQPHWTLSDAIQETAAWYRSEGWI